MRNSASFFVVGVCIWISACMPIQPERSRVLLDAYVEKTTGDAKTAPPVVVITLTNSGDRNVSLSRTHCGCTRWLKLELESANGNAVRYPPEMPELSIVRPPRYECFRPGEAMNWRIDLTSFRLEFGGEARSDLLSFRLEPGQYKLRARYVDQSARWSGCWSPDIDVASPWVTFAVSR